MSIKSLSLRAGRTGRIILVTAFSLTAVASAQAVTAEQRAACTPDAIRLCSSEIPDVAKVTACMKANQGSLSPRCRAAFLGATGGDRTVVAQRGHNYGTVQTHYRQASFHRGASFHQASFHQASFLPRHGKHSRQALRIAAQVFGMLGAACASGSVPGDVCSGGFLGAGGFGSGYGFGSSNGFGSAELMGYLGSSGLMDYLQ
jgi:hypothetical protein